MHKIVCKDMRLAKSISPYSFFDYDIRIECALTYGDKRLAAFENREDAERYCKQKSLELGLEYVMIDTKKGK